MGDWKSPHISGFDSPLLREICRDFCAFHGDPPCWTMDNEGPNGLEEITPCNQCLRKETRQNA